MTDVRADHDVGEEEKRREEEEEEEGRGRERRGRERQTEGRSRLGGRPVARLLFDFPIRKEQSCGFFFPRRVSLSLSILSLCSISI